MQEASYSFSYKQSLVTLEQITTNQLDFHACMTVVQTCVKYTASFVPLKKVIIIFKVFFIYRIAQVEL